MTDASTPTAATPDMTKTSITMVLDRSGSMNSCRKATIDAVNKYLEEAKSSDLKTADFELMIFDAKSIDVIRTGVLAEVAMIAEKDFEPRDMTPLYDAIGRGIDSLDKRNGDGKAILVIVTDGAENQSRKHTHASISELIQGRQDKGWLILFLGAGLENALQGTSLGIHAANVANIGLDEQSLGATIASLAATNVCYSLKASLSDAKDYAASEKFTPKMRKAMGDKSGGAGIVGGTPLPPEAQIPQDDSWSKTDRDDAWAK